uniref:Caspase family p20 domain-containing protein n=1 Tax=Arion vulgaris TaxID=1028688 RepID=A0A0B7ATK6_9EUPU
MNQSDIELEHTRVGKDLAHQENIQPTRRRAEARLDHVMKRGGNALDCNDAKKKKLSDVAGISKTLRDKTNLNSSTSHSEDYESSDESLPDTWPTVEAMNVCESVQLVEENHIKMTALFKKTLLPRRKTITYLMAAKPRGQVLIINNETFNDLPKRDGTSSDETAIETLFITLGFNVHVEKNKTSEEMWKVLEEEAGQYYHRQANCFVLFILSHGYTGVVFGTDGLLQDKKPINCIEINKIVGLFSRSKHLMRKPKLFFIQACQGGDKNIAQSLEIDSDSVLLEEQEPIAADVTRGEDICPIHDCIVCDGPTNESDVEDKLPYGTDVFVAKSTIPGYLSYRNTERGTWFIQAVVYVLAKYAYKHDLCRLMTLVNRLVATGKTGRCKQASKNSYTLVKDFYFFPGLFKNS